MRLIGISHPLIHSHLDSSCMSLCRTSHSYQTVRSNFCIARFLLLCRVLSKWCILYRTRILRSQELLCCKGCIYQSKRHSYPYIYRMLCQQYRQGNYLCKPCKYFLRDRQQLHTLSKHLNQCTLCSEFRYSCKQGMHCPLKRIQRYRSCIQYHPYCRYHSSQRYPRITCIVGPYQDKNYPYINRIYLSQCRACSYQKELSTLGRQSQSEDNLLHSQDNCWHWSNADNLIQQSCNFGIYPFPSNQRYLQYTQCTDWQTRNSRKENLIDCILYNDHHRYSTYLGRNSIRNYQECCYYMLCIPSQSIHMKGIHPQRRGRGQARIECSQCFQYILSSGLMNCDMIHRLNRSYKRSFPCIADIQQLCISGNQMGKQNRVWRYSNRIRQNNHCKQHYRYMQCNCSHISHRYSSQLREMYDVLGRRYSCIWYRGSPCCRSDSQQHYSPCRLFHPRGCRPYIYRMLQQTCRKCSYFHRKSRIPYRESIRPCKYYRFCHLESMSDNRGGSSRKVRKLVCSGSSR